MPAAVPSTAALPSASDGSATTWTMPSWSRRSTKHRPPRSRATSTQPHRVTGWPISASSTRPQKWVRMGDTGKYGNRQFYPSPGRSGATAKMPHRTAHMEGAMRRRGMLPCAASGDPRRLWSGGGRRGRGGRVGLGLGLGLGIGLLLATLAGQVALLLAVLLEVRLVPAASRQAE